MYLCLIIFNWHLFLLKFPSLLPYLDCIQGNVKDFSLNYSSVALLIALWVSLQSLAAVHEITLLSKTWWLPHKRILDYISFTFLFICEIEDEEQNASQLAACWLAGDIPIPLSSTCASTMFTTNQVFDEN